MASNYQLTNLLIQREAECVGKRMGFKIVKARYQFLLMQDLYGFCIIADNYFYSCRMNAEDLQLSLDDFSELYIRKGLQEILNSQIQYDDAGQII